MPGKSLIFFFLTWLALMIIFRLRKKAIVLEVPRNSFIQKLENYVGKTRQL